MDLNQNLLKNVTYRPIQKSDYPILADLISDTWGYKKFSSPKTAFRMGMLYLRGCLADQTYSCVAVKRGTPVGLILGRGKKPGIMALHHRLAQLPWILALLLTREGRSVARMFGGFSDIDSNLLKESGKQFDGELTLFVIRSDQRGAGIGNTLFGNFLYYLKSQCVKNFYLFTDTTCNYGFYEHKGLARIGEKSVKTPIQPDKEMQFFLYEYCA
ncbi:N-acetyltransferase [Diplocloster agilis]|uniref:N-acetyltransferase n=1 Tax=Diplocloster agilis TaxID=2850323 RepID=A0A949NIW1_9FIRM|nr:MULTISPECIES: N-acetyltransferase [Lachnospiraceae]MBU9738885.1 N-acetyltransferase [Diplocloster agilis]MBU9746991.1 N-acetyltransferase [Diplocloster agilis]MCU6732653.1 N-acetyltransferase [Suonthocola fibrivorans]SCI56107.1 Uncharacterised protein [uncultured Clostridium sp.]